MYDGMFGDEINESFLYDSLDIHMLEGMIYLIVPRGLETNLRDDCKPGFYGSRFASLRYQQFLL